MEPKTNMEVCDLINQQQPFNDGPYFNKDIHEYLLEKGAKFKQEKPYVLSYYFNVNDEDMRLRFFTDLDMGVVRIEYWWEDDGDDDTLPTNDWLLDYLFSIPVGTEALPKFKQILKAYIQEL